MSVRSLHHDSWKNWAKTKGTAPREIKFKFEKGQIVDTAIRPTLILIACGQKKLTLDKFIQGLKEGLKENNRVKIKVESHSNKDVSKEFLLLIEKNKEKALIIATNLQNKLWNKKHSRNIVNYHVLYQAFLISKIPKISNTLTSFPLRK